MKRNIKIICFALLVFMMHSCTDWLSVQPTDRQTEEQLYSTKSGFYAAMNGIYTKLNSNNLYGKALSYEAIEILAHRYVIKSNEKTHTALLTWSYQESSVVSKMDGIYKTAYNVILNCNILLKNIEKGKNVLGEKDYMMLKGEVLALRAFIHFDMLRMFGPIYARYSEGRAIPYSTSAVGVPSDIYTAQVVLNDYILKDILLAEDLLLKSDPVISEGALAPKNIKDEKEVYNSDNAHKYRQLRFNYFALLTLKARVQLYAGDKGGAYSTAKAAITKLEATNFFPFVDPNTLLGNSTNPDRMFSTEVLFCLYAKDRGLIYTEYFDPEKAGDRLIQPRTGFVNNTLFSGLVGDYRKAQWGASASSSNTDPVITKHKDAMDKLLFHSTIIPIIRVSELYLIAAETEANLTDGYAVLNRFRDARGNAPLPVVSSDNLNSQLLMEYCREFYAEGQLFFYLKRRNISLPNNANGNRNISVGFMNRTDRLVIPLPASETDPR